jgi:NAD(P)-dependent dehydrogenase (short-subunit alcohol dehydrogenase family)
MAAVHFHLENRVAVDHRGAQVDRRRALRQAVRAGRGPRSRSGIVNDELGATALLRSNSEANGARVVYCHCNVSRKDEVPERPRSPRLARRIGAVDVASSYNAGIFKAADFPRLSPTGGLDPPVSRRPNAERRVSALGKRFGRAMMRKPAAARFVNMSSVNAVMAIPSIASYNASKGGINQLTRVMALALAEHGVRVNAVAPGTIATSWRGRRCSAAKRPSAAS